MKIPRARNTAPRKVRSLRAALAVATVGLLALCIAVVTGIAEPASSSASPATCPLGSTLQVPSGGSPSDAQCVMTATGTPVGGGQARLADHPREQVLRRELHRAQPEQLSLADAAPAGRAAHPLLRHRPLQHGQLHLAGVRPVPVVRHPGRLLDGGDDDEQQLRDHHHRNRRHRHRHRPHDRRRAGRTRRLRIRRAPPTATTANSSCTAASTPRSRNNGCVYPTDVPTRVQPVQRGRRPVEGIRAGSRRRSARRSDHAT